MPYVLASITIFQKYDPRCASRDEREEPSEPTKILHYQRVTCKITTTAETIKCIFTDPCVFYYDRCDTYVCLAFGRNETNRVYFRLNKFTNDQKRVHSSIPYQWSNKQMVKCFQVAREPIYEDHPPFKDNYEAYKHDLVRDTLLRAIRFDHL